MFGEYHRTLYVPGMPGASSETRDKSALFSFIQTCTASNKPVAFILEASDHENKRIQELLMRIDPLIDPPMPNSNVDDKKYPVPRILH